MEALNVVAALVAVFSLAILLKGAFETKILADDAVKRLVDLSANQFKNVKQGPAKADAYRIRWWRRLRRAMSIAFGISTIVFLLTLVIGW